MEFPFLTNEMLCSLLGFLAGITITFVVSYYLNEILKKSFSSMILSQPKFITTFTIMRRLAVLCAIIIGVMATTFTAFPESLGIITSVFVAAGFASIVVGLAAQSSLSNIISGVINSVSQPFRIGDAVMFRNEFCYVEDMRLIHTIMKTWDNRRLVVPNSILQNEAIINYSMKDPSVLVPISVQVSYESDIPRAMQIMTEAARTHYDCMPSGDLPNTVVMAFQNSGILLRLLTMAKDQSTAFDMTRDLLLNIKMKFDEDGIEIPYPRQQIVLGRELSDKLAWLEDMWRSFSMN
mgnify:CR=1 FL=1